MSTAADEKDKSGKNKQFADRDLFRDVIGRFASGVTVITALNGRKFYTEAKTVCQSDQ